MGPRLPLLVAALASCLLPALGCILCDKKVLQELESLEKEYLPTHLRADHHIRLMARVNFALKDFTNLPINEDSYLGVIDEPTLEKASWSLLKELRRIKDSNVKDFCPNKCGRKVNVHETEDMILDCELNWHKASAALTDYSFYRVWDNKTQTLEYKGKGPTLVKTMVEPKDEGVYLCKLETTIGVTATIIRFHVKVLPKKTVEEKSSDMDDDTGLDDTTWYPIQPTSQPMTSAPTVENMLKSLLVGLLIWGFVVLMASIVIV